jgi:hypothetical protein
MGNVFGNGDDEEGNRKAVKLFNTGQTTKFVADMALPAFSRRDPVLLSEWRIVPHKQLMPAIEFGNPVQIFVLAESDDSA